MDISDNIIMKVDDDNSLNVDRYRCIVKTYLDLHRYKTALYWADKVLTLSKGEIVDIFWLAQCMFLSKQYHRAAHLIKSRNAHTVNAQCCYLAAACLNEAKEFNDGMELLYTSSIENFENDKNSSLNLLINNGYRSNESRICGENALLSSIHFERGKVYEAVDNRELATESYKQALFADVHCYEAFEAIIQHHVLSASEEQQLIHSLPLNEHCPTERDREFIRLLYERKLNKYHGVGKLSEISNCSVLQRLENNLDFVVAEAERHYYNSNYNACWKLTQSVIAKDPYHTACLPLHISSLVELKNSNELFLLAHRLVKIYPEDTISWFAVGCYYYVIGKSDPARRYLGKATALDKLFGPAWLAYGHSFAAESEHDQAMAAYFKASQLMKGCHLPLLYIGLENGLTNNSLLAEKFFLQAQAIAPADPFVIHEMGVIAFQTKEYERAKTLFEEAYEKIKGNEKNTIPVKWEPLLNNLGHVYRKLKKFKQAVECHLQAMLLAPENPTTYSAIGYCQVFLGETSKAVESFHRALSLKQDDAFCTTMLNYLLQQLIDNHLSVDVETPTGELFSCAPLVQYSPEYNKPIRMPLPTPSLDDTNDKNMMSLSVNTP